MKFSRAVAKDVRPRGADTNELQTEDSPNICMYNGAENISSGADRGPNAYQLAKVQKRRMQAQMRE